MPRFLERDECERERPCAQYPWDGVRNVRPFSRFQKSDVVEGVVLSASRAHAELPSSARGGPTAASTALVVPHYRTREPFVEISQANVGPDPPRPAAARRRPRAAAGRFPSAELVGDVATARPSRSCTTPCRSIPIERHRASRPQDYVEQLSATTGLPYVLVRRNMDKIARRAGRVEEVLAGLTRGLDLSRARQRRRRGRRPAAQLLPARRRAGRGAAEQLAGRALAVGAGHRAEDAARAEARQRRAVDAVPHHPGLRRRRAVRAEAFGYYPADHAGGNEILRSCGRGMVFGDVGRRSAWKADPRVELHGPGYSKVVLGADAADDWERLHRRDRRVDRRTTAAARASTRRASG